MPKPRNVALAALAIAAAVAVTFGHWPAFWGSLASMFTVACWPSPRPPAA